MTATIVAQQAINGIVLGSLYVLVALGLTLIYGVLVQINFAHADFVTLGAFAAYFFMHVLGGSYLASIGAALVVGAVLGWAINVTIFAPLRHKGSELLPLIATIGVSTMHAERDAGVVRADAVRVRDAVQPEGLSRRRHRSSRCRASSSSWSRPSRSALLYAFMRFTFLGKALRAVSQDRETAGLMGINPNHLIMLTFMIASALAGMGGAMLAPVLVLTPFAGTS